MNRKQAASSVMMIRPDGFGYNPETAASNSFQQAEGSGDIQRIREFRLSTSLKVWRQP